MQPSYQVFLIKAEQSDEAVTPQLYVYKCGKVKLPKLLATSYDTQRLLYTFLCVW